MRYVFADESSIHGNHCYGIGALMVEESALDAFTSQFTDAHRRLGIVGEAKWKKVGGSRGLINLSLEQLDYLLHADGLHFSCIVVNTAKYNNWREDNFENAFYKTYSQLLRNSAQRLGGDFRVYMDQKSDSYPKHDEVVEIVTNRMLGRAGAPGAIESVSMKDSRMFPGIQVADLLTGPIVAAHNRYLNRGLQLNGGKNLLMARMAAVLGWDDLCYDTWPSSLTEAHFNVWQFPIESRADPGSRPVVPKAPVFVEPGEP